MANPVFPPKDPLGVFQSEVATLIRSLAFVRDVADVPDDFALDVHHDDGKSRVFLENHYAETREMSPTQRHEYLSSVFSCLKSKEELSWEAARECLVAVIRGTGFDAPTASEVSWLGTSSSRDTLLRRPFLPFIDLLVVLDQRAVMTFVTLSNVERWGVGMEEVFDAAVQRATLHLDPEVELYDDRCGPLWVVADDDYYESSRLLIPKWLASFRGRVDGRPVAIVPERSTLMVGGDGRPEMVERLLGLAEREFMASGRRISCALYTVDDDEAVVPYRPGPSSPCGKQVDVAHEELAAFEYGEQKRILDDRLPELFVASYLVFDLGNGRTESRAAWTKGVTTLLPRTDQIALVTPKPQGGELESAVLVPFDAVARHLHPLPDLHPQRFCTGTFPSAKQLAEWKMRFARKV